MKYFYLLILISSLSISLGSRVSVESNCESVLKCQNHARFDHQKCTCNCLPNYSGELCENLNCDKLDSINCLSIEKKECNDSLRASYCPHMCSKCSVKDKLKSLIPHKNRQLITTCQNSGQYNANELKCNCFPSYAGNDCSQLLCNKTDPSNCNSYNSNYCTVKLVNDYCPRLCNKCKCSPLTCQNGGRFNNLTCTCDCFPGYTGNQCQTLKCDSDPLSCNSYDAKYCSLIQISQYCPIKCGKCANITPIPSSSTTRPACIQSFTCLNGGLFNNKTCKCDCFASSTGTKCETLLCNQDPVACASYSSTYCSVTQISNYCPTKCGRCGVNNPTTQSTPSTQVTQTAQTTQTPQTTAAGTSTSIPQTVTSSVSLSSATSVSTTVCNIICKNGADVKPDCTCGCLPGYSGNDCSIIDVCEDRSTDCAILATQCDQFNFLCPKSCSLC